MAFHITGWEQAVMFVYISMCVPIEVMVKVHLVDLKCETIAPPVSVRAYLNQTVTEFKQLIAQIQLSHLHTHIHTNAHLHRYTD